MKDFTRKFILCHFALCPSTQNCVQLDY